MSSEEQQVEYAMNLESTCIEIEKSIQNTINMLMTFVTDCKSLQNEIETAFELFETTLRERKKFILNELSKYQDEHLMIFKEYSNKLQSNKQSVIVAQQQQKLLISDKNIDSTEKTLRIQQITDNVINDTNIDGITEAKNEFIVDSVTICNIISNIGSFEKIEDSLINDMEDKVNMILTRNDENIIDDVKAYDVINFTEEIEDKFDMNEIKRLFKPIIVNHEYDEKEAIWNEIIMDDNDDYQYLKYWTISKGEEMNKFRNCDNFEMLTGPIINIKDILFECTIAPNGNSSQTLNFVMFGIRINSLPQNVSQIIAYIILFCKESNYAFKTTKIFQKIDDFQFWPSKSLSLNECINNESLTFGCFIEIIHIEYIENNKFYMKQIKMDRLSEYEWNISKYMLYRFENARELNPFYSPSFMNNCFCIICFPKGIKKGSENTFSFKVKLLQIPYNINAIKCNIKLKCASFENIEWEKIEILRYSKNKCLLGALDINITKSDKFNKLQSMEVKVSIEILNIYDENGKEINKESWNQFGINQ